MGTQFSFFLQANPLGKGAPDHLRETDGFYGHAPDRAVRCRQMSRKALIGMAHDARAAAAAVDHVATLGRVVKRRTYPILDLLRMMGTLDSNKLGTRGRLWTHAETGENLLFQLKTPRRSVKNLFQTLQESWPYRCPSARPVAKAYITNQSNHNNGVTKQKDVTIT